MSPEDLFVAVGLESFDEHNGIMEDADQREYQKNQCLGQEYHHGPDGKLGKHAPYAVVFAHVFARGDLFQIHHGETEGQR
jgi:hypothetical protein